MIEKIGYWIGIALFVFAVVVLTCSLLGVKWAQSEDEQLRGVTSIYHETEEVVYNETNTFGVKTTVFVEKSDCLKCLGRFACEECKIFTCEDVNCE